MSHNTGTHTLLMMLNTRGSAPYLTAACDKERQNSQRNRKKREISRDLHKFFIISGQFLAAVNGPFYSCLLSDLAFDWQRGWR